MKSHFSLCKAIIILFIISLSTQSYAQDSLGVYKLSWGKDIGLVAFGSAAEWGALKLKDKVAPLTSEEVLALDREFINRFDRPAIDRYCAQSAERSDIIKMGSFGLPLLTMFSKGARKEVGEIAVMYLEVMGINAALTELAKNAVKRKRPYVYNEALTLEQRLTNEGKRSFYSGHVSHVTTMSFFTARVLSDYHPDSDLEWLWWTSALAIPAYTAYLRYDAGRHFPSDLLVGYGMGAMIGYFIPGFHETKHENINITLSTGDLGNSLVGVSIKF